VKKYWQVFKISWANILEYRFDFLVARVRNIVLLLTLYFLWSTVFASRNSLAGFSKEQMIFYVLASNIIFSVIFVHSMDDFAYDISSGNLSVHLVKPMNYLAYWFVRRIASRTMNLLMVFLETAAFVMIVKPDLSALSYRGSGLGTFGALALALVIFTLVDFVVGLTAFWTLRAYGPRFSWKVIMEFAAGRFFPLNILPYGVGKVLEFLPFAYLTYWPTTILSRGVFGMRLWLVGLAWVAVLAAVLGWVWRRGLRVYEAYGG